MQSGHDKSKITALTVTLAVSVLIVVLLHLVSLHFNPDDRPVWPPEDTSELLLADEFVEVEEIPELSRLQTEVAADADASAAPDAAQEGDDMADAGAQGSESPQPVASDRTSPMKVKPQKPEAGPVKPTEKPAEKPSVKIKETKFSGRGTSTEAQPSKADGQGNNTESAAPGNIVGKRGGKLAGRMGTPSMRRPSGVREGQRITVRIEADREGNIKSVEISTPTDVTDEVVKKAAVEACRKIRINPDPNAPALQSGTITFIFSNR